MEKYWRSLEELKNGPDGKAERAVEEEQKNLLLDLADRKITNANASRRDFLKLVGFSFATAAITSSCEKPVQKAIPYLVKPEEVTPGKASYYASGFYDGSEYCPIVAKVRDGRPIKIEANKLSPVSAGGTSARVQASVLELYDQARQKEPAKGKESVSWDEIDRVVTEKLKSDLPGRKVLLTPSVISPSTKNTITQLREVYPDLEWIVYDEISATAIRRAHDMIFGKPVIPGIHFDRADYIVSFDADFLGTWIAPVDFSAGYASKREVSKEHPEMSKHIQFESGYSITGSNADERMPVTPAESKAILAKLYNAIAASKGAGKVREGNTTFDVSKIAADLLAHQGNSIVVAGSNDPQVQLMIAGINAMLGNYGNTLDLFRHFRLKQGDDQQVSELLKSMGKGRVSLLIMQNVNPVYSHIAGKEFGDAIRKTGTTVYIGSGINETSDASEYNAPDHHYLEAWGDAEHIKGSFSLQQPTIHPLYNTRAFQDSLLKWSGSEKDYYQVLREYWEEKIYPLSGSSERFENWWNKTLQDGGMKVKGAPSSGQSPDLTVVKADHPAESEGMTLTLYSPVGLMDGRHANNPWLQELPDPVTKVCWDNYLAVSPSDAEKLGLVDEEVVELNSIRVPVLIQPGQAKGTCSMALGYGRKVAGKVGDDLGINAFIFVQEQDGYREYTREGIRLEKTGESYSLARTQTHDNMEERPIVREATLDAFKKDPYAGNHFHLEAESHHESLYPDSEFNGFHWGLTVDLNKCTGCNNCIVACVAENNIATVGKEEVKNRRIMHWIRVDRYFSDNPDNPKTYHQPVMCQHCDNAPCENVCPVAATTHSKEGLNQQAYARCIGTKYCINNCPYRVRRFNWFKYVNNDKFNFHLNEESTKMVLNPDVTVRSRGVVEKCSFCIQRIQEKKLEAKLENRRLRDGEVQPSCVQSCPTGALVFGNMNDKDAKVSKLKRSERNYHLLEQLHTLPSVGYLTLIRNTEGEGEEPAHEQNEHHS